MRRRLGIALLAAVVFAITPAAAQGGGGATTDGDFWYNLIGLVGLLGLRGLWRDSDNDGYTDDPV